MDRRGRTVNVNVNSQGKGSKESVQHRGHVNYVLKFGLNEKARDEENEAIAQLRIFRVQVFLHYSLRVHHLLLRPRTAHLLED